MDSFKFLLKRGDTVCAAVDGATVLLEAIDRRRPDFVRYLVVNAGKLGLDVPRARDCHGRSALFHAVAVGSREIVDRLIEAGCSLHDEDRRGRSVVMEAAVHGRLDMLKYLAQLAAASADRCPSFSACDDDGRNVLFYCVESGDIQVLDYVLSLGIRHRPDSSSRTILMQAARSGNPSVTVYLLEGVRSGDILHLDPAAVDCRGESALHYGIRSGCGAVVAALLDDGRLRLDTTAFLPPQQQHQSLTNADGRCGGMVVSALPQDPLDVALGDPRLSDVCRLLLDRLPMESGVGRRDCLGRTPLFRFVEHGLIGLLRSYAPGNYRPGDTDNEGLTLLMYACCHANLDRRRTADVIKYIVEQLGADLTAVDSRGRTALFHAVESGQLDTVSYLLTKWSTVVRSPSSSASSSSLSLSPSATVGDIKSPSSSSLLSDIDGRSLLMEAISSCRPRMVSALLESSIGRELVSAVDRDGRGPIHYWVTQPEPEATENHGGNAATAAAGNSGTFGSDGAESDRSGSPGAVTPASGASSASSSSSSTASGSGTGGWRNQRMSILAMLVAHRCDVNLPDAQGGLTPLMYAARIGRAWTVNALLNQLPRDLIRVNAVDADRRTALHHCCNGSADEMTAYFAERRRGGNAETKTTTIRQPSLRCCQALVRAGIDVNAPDKAGRTALMLACQSYVPGANVSVIRYLVEHGGADPVRQDADGRDSFDYCPPIDSDYVRAVLREGAEMAKAERSALREFADRLIAMQHPQNYQQHQNFAPPIFFNNGFYSSSSSPYGGCSLHIASVLRGLVREGIFTRTLSFEVMKQAPADRLRKLVDLLCCRGDRAFAAFCRVLKNEAAQPELAYMMMKAAYCRQQEIFC